MPINIFVDSEGKDPEDKVAWLAEDSWELPTQMEELREWLATNRSRYAKDNYIADVGFHVRRDAMGGGAVIDVEMMGWLVELGMEIFLSEYPENWNESMNRVPVEDKG